MPNTSLGKVSLTPKGEYSAESTYKRLDVIQFGGNSFIVRKEVTGVEPVEGEYYFLMTSKGLSAYELAKVGGYEGTVEEWLLSLKGLSAYQIAQQAGFEGTEEEWLISLKGLSAYQIAQQIGFKGTEEEWLTSLRPTETEIAEVVGKTQFESLETEAKDLVGAINEVKRKIPDVEEGTFGSLSTESKAIIGAINELNGKVQDILGKLA